jgi:hydrogenase small subunit
MGSTSATPGRLHNPFSELDRRGFMKVCSYAAAAVGLGSAAGVKFAEAAAQGRKPSVIWLSFQECTGCTESLLRTSHPDLAELILDLISLDYHEALLTPSGHAAERTRLEAMEQNEGKFIMVVEGAIPTKDGGIYCQIGGKPAIDILQETAEKAGAIIAIGSCASFGGIPAADPNPTGAKGAPQILTDKTVVSLPGCPSNPYNFLGVALQYATFGSLPALDEKGRPLFAYGRTIHEHCPRRAHFDAGRFAEKYGDEGHRSGYCLYKLGCKGPRTHANCSTLHFGDVVDAWPIGIGHPCYGCTEEDILWRVALHDKVKIDHLTPPDTYAPIAADRGGVSAIATGVGGVLAGAAIGASFMASRKLEPEQKPATGGRKSDDSGGN